jgi:hypothetical protein
MSAARRCCVITAVAILLLSHAAMAQDSIGIARNSLGFRVGYAATPGEWSNSPVVPSVKLYGGGFTYEGDLEFRIAPLWTLGAGGGYVALNGSEWEDYARGQGDVVSVSAWAAHAEMVIRPHIELGPDDLLKVELGVAAVFAGGSEAFASREYSYEDLPDYAFGGILGLEYQHLLSKKFAFSLRGSFLLFPGALNSLGGMDQTMMFVPITAGFRVLF